MQNMNTPLSIPVVLCTIPLSTPRKSSRGWTVEAKYTDGITHVVCGTEKGTRTVNIRSVKYLRAVAAGKWVVTDAWLQECQLRDIQTAEEGFEISGDKKSTVPSGPRRSRILHADPASFWTVINGEGEEVEMCIGRYHCITRLCTVANT